MSVEKSNVLHPSPLHNNNIDPKRQIIVLRKPDPEIILTNTAKRRSSSKMTRVHNPPPVAVARRNARERNRVKQVNNGFATLRQHIPSAIAATYETGNGRGSNKKLSKVETLRMAVEYIKSLEKLLSISEDNSNPDIDNNYSNNIQESMSLTGTQFNVTYTYSKADENRLKKDYLIYEDEENIHPLKMENMDEEILQNSTLSSIESDITLLHSMDHTASLSPEVYSEHSLSPVGLDPETKSYIPVFNVPNQNILPSFSQLAYERLPHVKSELLSPQLLTDSEAQTVCIITRSENDNPIDIVWWDQQQES